MGKADDRDVRLQGCSGSVRFHFIMQFGPMRERDRLKSMSRE